MASGRIAGQLATLSLSSPNNLQDNLKTQDISPIDSNEPSSTTLASTSANETTNDTEMTDISPPPPPTDWKRIGNEHFVAKNYLDAIAAYTSGLDIDPTNVDLLSNRSASYLAIFRFEPALSDADAALKINPTHIKSICRKVKALCGLKLFEVALDFLDNSAKELAPGDKIIQQLQETCTMFVAQSKYGIYPQRRIVQNYELVFSVDWADYYGPFEVKETPDGKGRGLFATDFIPVGQLILATKALGIISRIERKVDKVKEDVASSSSTNEATAPPPPVHVSSKCQLGLLRMMVNALQANPEQGLELYQLYAGPELKYLDPSSFKGTSLPPLDLERIAGILVHNCFGEEETLHVGMTQAGLWYYPSFINHSCVDCNSFKLVYGDFMFIRAFKDIKPGEEITMSYVDPTDSYDLRSSFFKKFGFQCNCSLCEYDRSRMQLVDEEKEKNELIAKIESLKTESETGGKTFTKEVMPVVIESIERLQLLSPNTKLNLFLVSVMAPMISIYLENDINLVEVCHPYMILYYRIIKDVPALAEIAFTASITLIVGFIRSDQVKKAKRLVESLKKTTIRAYGSLDILEMYEGAVDVMRKHGLNV